MVFSSNVFLLVFLPLFLGVYYLAPMRWRSLVIIFGSYTFYAWWRIDFLALFVAVTVWSYVIGLLIVKAKTERAAKFTMLVGVFVNLGVLAIFKYFNFFYDSLASLLSLPPAEQAGIWRIILPIGISFYIFQAISYLIDVYRKDAPPARNFVDFAAFIALFPQLIAGPVLRYKDLADQIQKRTHNMAKFAEGARYFMIGLCKKILIADSVAPLVDTTFSLTDPTMAEAWLGALAYTVQLYFDFSGYSDMAVGLGLMIGFRFVQNFNMPYISRSITEFWRRWHISLSNWLRDYLYITLGGNRCGTVRTYVNLFLTMLLGGFWHGANWTFILWGMWHGGILATERALAGKGNEPYPAWLAWPLTMLFVIIGWVMFRADNVGIAFGFYKAMLGANGIGFTDAVAWQISRFDVTIMLIGMLICAIEPFRYKRIGARPFTTVSMRYARASSAMLVVLTLISILKLSADSYSPFLYFQF
ncbi:MAG: MBOAT family O-acyltransferase [bacterium]